MKQITFDSKQIDNWKIENDTVMGGESNSTIEHVIIDNANYLKFSGQVSMENNGGFAQTITQHEYDLSNYSQVTVNGHGDNKTYKLRFETSANKVAYQAEFRADKKFSHTIQFSDLEKTYHGRNVPDTSDFDPANVLSIGILIGNGHAESFELNVTSLAFE